MGLVVAVAQSASFAGDVSRNVEHHLNFARQAAHGGARFLLFPELSLTGYELGLARAHPVTLSDARLDPLRHLAREAGMTILVGAPLPGEGDELHIGLIGLLPDGGSMTYAKEHVHSSETPPFSPGPGGPLLDVQQVPISLAICFDATHPDHAARASARGAGIYAVSVMIDDAGYDRKTGFLERYARDHRMAVLMANHSGVTGGEVSAGRSALWSEDGRRVISVTDAGEALLIASREGEGWSARVLPM